MKRFEQFFPGHLRVFSLWMTVGLFPLFLVSVSFAENGPGLHSSLKGGVKAKPGYAYSFPRDHGSHNLYGLEWWYFTGHLSSESGRWFGYELTFFRKTVDNHRVQKSSSRWAIKQLYFAHLALTDVEAQSFHFAEKLSRAGLGKAGADHGQMNVWIDRWSLSPVTPDHQSLSIQASERSFGLDLTLKLKKPPVIHGEEGVSRKGAEVGQASHYYSLTRLGTQGALTLGGEQFDVTGLSWMDHEFGSGELGLDQVGWDWFSLQFDSNVELMVYLLRRKNGSVDPVSSGTLIYPDGRSEHLSFPDIRIKTLNYWASPHTNVRYPAEWELDIPSVDLRVNIKPVLADQELRTSKSTHVTYWEGAVEVSGQHQDAPIQGLGYVELTGYDQPLKMGRE